jgi:hypothetical protein
MTTQNTIEDDLDVIRDKIYEKVKDMTPSERTAYFNHITDPVIEKYGLRVVKSVQEAVSVEK